MRHRLAGARHVTGDVEGGMMGADPDVEPRCSPAPEPGKWVGFELHRDVTVTEEVTLGTGTSQVNAQLWDPAAVECFKSGSGMNVMGVAVNTADDYKLADKIGLDAVLVDSPPAALAWRDE